MATSKTTSKASSKSTSTRASSKSSTPSAKSKSGSQARAKSKSTQSKNAMERFKTEVASELGVNLKSNDLTAKQAGRIGGEMVRRMIKQQADQMK